MRRLILITGAAAFAIGAPSAAKPGGGEGGKPDKQQGGGGRPDKAEKRGGGSRAERTGGGGEYRYDAGPAKKEKRAFVRSERGGDWDGKPGKSAKAARVEGERGRYAKAGKKTWKGQSKRGERGGELRYKPDAQVARFGERQYERSRFVDSRDVSGVCPPGLAKKGNGCLPPGQAKNLFSVGQVLPAAYFGGYNVPSEYQDWYQESSDSGYRYDDSGYIYGVDGQSGLISSLIPLLGGGFGIGNVLPAGYDNYNLPLSYRDDFADSEEVTYRYGDDAIYEIDPQTQMIQAVVALLSGDLNVGQALPSGYDTYNLPMEYRDQYQDSNEAMYRYGDGNIYQVDPKSMIIEQIVAQLT